MWPRTAPPEAGPQPLPASPRTPRLAPQWLRWSLPVLALAYVVASLGGAHLEEWLHGAAYLPPLAGFAFMAAFFGLTLRAGSEPLIERVARREHPELPPELVTYTRQLTLLWALTFAGMAIVSLLLALVVPFTAWSRGTHAVAVAIPAILFFGEYFYRLHRHARHRHAPIAQLAKNIVSVIRDMALGRAAPGPAPLPLLLMRSADAPLLVDAGRTVSAGEFIAQAQALARALPEGTHAVNIGASRHAFLVGFAGALLRGRASLMPPGQARGDWERLLAAYPGAVLLGDARPENAPASWIDVREFLAPCAASDGVPTIAPGTVAAILFTSGSTGEPQGHAKTWGQLWTGASAWADALAATGAFAQPGETPASIVGSIPPQHMFGLESTVLLPLASGLAMHGQRPLLPADLEAALRSAGAGAWWMTTPMHLRAALASGLRPEGLRGIVSSTMSLAPALAREAQERWGVPVVEVYGSTETGAIATRRTATEERWQPLPGLRLTPGDAGFEVEGAHVGTRVRLGDLIEIDSDGRFLWKGRAADLVKVAGKRASLAALDRRLQEVAGVDDGAFFAPEAGGDKGERLTAFYVSATLEPAQVVAALREQLDSVFLPRPCVRVASLPRNANGKLPRAALSELHAASLPQWPRFTISPGHPALPGHFPGDAIVPGALILARVAEALRAGVPAGALHTLETARFHAPLRPGESAAVSSRNDGERLHFEVHRGSTLLASGAWRLGDAP